MTIVTYPAFLQTQSYSAQKLRYQQEQFTPNGEGVMGQADFRVSQRGLGANMSVDVAAGDAVVRGDSITRQGLYMATNDATINAAIAANSSGNPRVDRVVLTLNDSTDSSSGTDISTITVIAGTPTAGATLDNLTGAAAVPNNALLLADVVVANGAASIVDANIRSRRTLARPGVIPPTTGLFDVDSVPMMPVMQPINPGGNTGILVAQHVNYQAASLCWLPRRIVGATKLRWRFAQNLTAATGNYIFGIYDASGRLIVGTASTAFSGAGLNTVVRSEALTATTTFEAGMYYVLMGNTIATAGAGVVFVGVGPPVLTTNGYLENQGAGQSYVAGVPGTVLRSTTGGVTLPSTILGLTDVGQQASTIQLPGIPLVSLSVT